MTYRYITILVALFALWGCEDFLNKEPQDEISKNEALDDIQSLQLALNGAYNLMGDNNYYAEFFLVYPELSGGNLHFAENVNRSNASFQTYLPIYRFSVQAESETIIEAAYPEMYRVLNAVNNIINAVPALPDGTEAQRNQLLGEALALRALIHFDLLRLYAQPYGFTEDASHPGIVALTETPGVSEQRSRATVTEAYELITSDLERAIDLMPPLTNPYRLSAEGARGLLARVYLYQGEWSRAASLAGEVINNGSTRLATTEEYPEIWRNNYVATEYVFRLSMRAPDQTFISDLLGKGAPRPVMSISDDLFSLYRDTDVRALDSLIQTDEDGNLLSGKHPFAENVASDVPVLRLSELYLTRAEALARLGRPELAQADLDAIRLRADPSLEAGRLTGQALLDAILLERRKELALEGHLLFDLARTGRDVVRLDCPEGISCLLPYPDPRFVLPLPQNALDANENLQQNDGY
jgi:hypothetical protein